MRLQRLHRVEFLGLIVILLLLQFGLRSYNPTLQPADTDESRHSERASIVWQFEVNPGQFSYGKLLVYYWLGLFEGDRSTALAVSRLAIALFSLITGACVYRLGAQLATRPAGLLALLVYCLLLLSLYHERMAFADPFAAGLVCLVAWRSIIFGKKPSLREGVLLGALLALASLAKLTAVMIPLLPVVASMIYMPLSNESLRAHVTLWFRRYFPPLCVAAGVVILMWLPILVPAYLARNSAQPFMLINNENVAAFGEGPQSSVSYVVMLIQQISDFTSSFFLASVGIAALVLLINGFRRAMRQLQTALFLLFWLALLVGPMIMLATDAAIRYTVPLAAPAVILLACGVDALWATQWLRLPIRGLLVVAVGTWLIGFALPMTYLTLTAPQQLPLTGSLNYFQYLSGNVDADTTIQLVAHYLDRPDLGVTQRYADQGVCYLIYFYVRSTLNCLDAPNVNAQVIALVQNHILDSGSMALVVNGDIVPPPMMAGVCLTKIARFTRETAYPVDVWKLANCGH